MVHLFTFQTKKEKFNISRLYLYKSKAMKSWNWKFLKKLARSFSIHEKRYLESQIVPIKNKTTNDYSEFFNTIIKDDLLSEEDFKNSIGGKNISLEKAKFAQQLFTHLRNFNENTSIEINLHNALCDIEILFTKQLYEFCFELINYNLKTSLHYQMYEITLQLIRWKRKCLSRIDNKKLTKKHLKELNELEQECYFQLSLIFQLKIVQQELLQIINKKGSSFDEDDKKKSLELLNHLNIDSTKISALIANAIYNEINSWIAYYVHIDNNLALEFNTTNYELLKKSKHLIAVHPQMFLSIYYSYYKRSFLNNRDKTLHILKEIKELHTSKKINIPEDVRVQSFMLYSEVEMLEHIDSKRFQEAIDLFTQNKKYLSKHSAYIKKYYLIINYYCLGLAHFFLKEFSQALRYTKQNIDNFNDSIRLDYYMYNLTLNFIIHIELGNSSIYKYLSSTYNRALKKHQLQDSEIGIYAIFFQQIAKKEKPTKDLFLKTYKSLETFSSKSNKGTYSLHVEQWFLEKYENFNKENETY